MKETITKSKTIEHLRHKAIDLLKKKGLNSASPVHEADALKLIHELEVHQIELEMQNEELQRSRSAAIDSSEKYIELYNFSPVGYFTLSRKGIIRELNLYGSKMLGKERSRLKNDYFESFVSNDTKAIFKLFLSKVFNIISNESCEVSLITNGENPMYVNLTGMVIGNGNKCLMNVTDITRLRQAETEIKRKNEELVKLNTEKDKYFSILAHDLRGPFGSFLGLTKILAEQLHEMNQNEIQEIASLLNDSATSVYNLIGNLLEWSRMQRGLIVFKPETVSLKKDIKKNILSLTDFANQKNQEIQFQVPEDLTVRVDLNMLDSTLRNLLSNALKFSNRGGKVLVSARIIQDYLVEITIKDHGIGISANLLSKLFQINGPLGRNGTEGEPSTGLGLLLCKEFVEKNGGKIRVESIEGKGSTFSFTLPMMPNLVLKKSLQTEEITKKGGYSQKV